jgi:hypothetical protein
LTQTKKPTKPKKMKNQFIKIIENNELYTEAHAYLFRAALEALTGKAQGLLLESENANDGTAVYVAAWDIVRASAAPSKSHRITAKYGTRDVFYDICTWVDRYTSESTQSVWFEEK